MSAHMPESSLDALRKFSQALKAEDEGDMVRAIGLMEEDIALDSTFAMAYRKLAAGDRRDRVWLRLIWVRNSSSKKRSSLSLRRSPSARISSIIRWPSLP